MDSGYILLVEDEQTVQMNNKKILQRRGYSIKQAHTLAQAREIIEEAPPRGIILDINLPDGNGIDFLKDLRKSSDIPVLILTAMGTREDIILGFETGSDDYLTKPYDLSVFLMRVEALLRRSATVPETLEYEVFTLYPLASRALLSGEDMLLSQKEYVILQLFVQNPGKILSADYLYTKAWGYEMHENDQSLKVAISKLRSKMTDSDFTVTASRGEGYYLERL